MNLYDQIITSNIDELKTFINKHKLNKNDIMENYLIFEQFLNEFIQCKFQPNLENCQQIIPGYAPKLIYDNKRIYIIMNDCAHKQAWAINNKIEINYLMRHFSDDLLKLTTKDLKFNKNDDERKELINNYVDFIKNPNHIGLYIYGRPGTGKTYISIIFANKLAELGKKVAFVFTAQLAQELKQSFQYPGMFDKILNNLKKCDVLFLDDIAGESISEWFRDDILFNILNYRMLNNLATFFTSNYNLNELHNYYKRNNKNSTIELVKAERLLERIKVLAKAIQLNKTILRSYNS